MLVLPGALIVMCVCVSSTASTVTSVFKMYTLNRLNPKP